MLTQAGLCNIPQRRVKLLPYCYVHSYLRSTEIDEPGLGFRSELVIVSSGEGVRVTEEQAVSELYV